MLPTSLPCSRRHALLAALVPIAAVVVACASAPPATTEAGRVAPRSSIMATFSTKPTKTTLALLHFGDSEAGLLADLETAQAGVARTHAVLEALRGRHVNVVTLHAGDTMIPSPELIVEVEPVPGAEKRSALLAGNDLLRVQAAALGNHDLDMGESFLADAIKGATFPWVASTLRVTTGPLAGLLANETMWVHQARGRILRRALVCTGPVVAGICGGGSIGVVAASPESLRLITRGVATLHVPDNVAGTVARLQAQVDALRAEGLSTIVLLAHRQGIEHDLALLDAGLTGVDVIISGGGEELLASTQHRLATGTERDVRCALLGEPCYPIVRMARDGAPVALVATVGNLRAVGELVVTLDEDGVLTGVDPRSRPWPVDETSALELRVQPDRADVAFERRVRDALQPMQDVIGETPVFLDGVRENVRNGETNLGNASADALLLAARAVSPAVTAAFRNGGGIRGSIGAVDATGARRGKPVTVLDLKTTLRFDSRIVVVELTHAALARTVEAALRGAGSARGHFPQVSRGVELLWATGGADQEHDLLDGRVKGVACDGTRLRRLVIPGIDGGPVVVVDGGVVRTPEARATVATIDFLAQGGDGWFPGMKLSMTPTTETEQSSFRRWLTDPAARARTLASSARIKSTDAAVSATCVRVEQ
ncbi:MAG: bifunctional metallophosphatase/5'-nucleotidase [Deltaproteobacteria bacterium]|nr:bifunctional metallophosphatase/5'-nucleotidase [Deltaproteobacteria bacterium]